MKKLFTVLGIIAALAAAVTWLIRRAIARARRLPPVPGTQRLIGNELIHYEKGGDGPPIVLLHGFAESTFTWRDIMPDLERDYRVFAIDLPPFGYSSRLTELDYSQRAQAERVVRIMDHLDIDRAVIVGHSMGGGIAQRVAMAHPERVAGLVLIAPVDPLDAARFERGQRRAQWLVPLLTVALRFRPTGRLAIRRALQDMSFNDRYITPEVVDGYRLPLTLKGTRRAYFKMFRDILDESPAQGGPITAPTLVIAGRHDTVINQKVTDRIAGRIEGAELRVIDDGAHMLPDEHPEAITAAIREVAQRAYTEAPATPK